MTLVKNISGTSDSICKCGSWLAHWEKQSKQTANFCSEAGCISEDMVGAHVQKANSDDNRWYIVPLCKLHNLSTNELEVVGPLISANREETCER